MTNEMSRRHLLIVGMAGLGVVAATSTAPAGRAQGPDVQDALAGLEERSQVRLGVYVIDTSTQATTGYRADERFLLCSTAKTLTVAAVLKHGETDPDLLNRVIRYQRSDVLAYAPVTSLHVDDGMTVAALCDAAITVSDNTAANLLVNLVGGPAAVTAFARSLGDDVTRIDRLEPDLNETSPGDLRDTSTPAQMARDIQALVIDDALDDVARQRFTELLKANTTGNQTIRAGVPSDWIVGDKTGSGAQGEGNDVAVAWPPRRAPLVIAIYVAPNDPHLAADDVHGVIAEATRIVTGS